MPAQPQAADCAFTPAPATRLQGLTAVADYQPVLKACVAADGRKAVAIREMTISGQKVALLADPEALTTRLERAACWTCRDESEGDLNATRMGRAIRESAQAPGLIHRGFLQNAGLTHGGGQGDFVTGDLCPSKTAPRSRLLHPARGGEPARFRRALDFGPLADPSFRRLPLARRSAQRSGALDILWTDHTFHHPYHRKLPDDANFLLSKGVDPQEEILDTERLLIANGETPSLFFRFPGLVSSDPLMQAVSQFHLVTLGADAWLALGQKPGHGSIVLVHPNGNEPKGLALFSADLAHGAIAAPLEPLTAAPD